MTVNTRSFIASVTKTVTAVATLQLLEANDLTVTAKIAPWLPSDWVKGPGIAQLTFRDLMQHKTGFKEIFMVAWRRVEQARQPGLPGLRHEIPRGCGGVAGHQLPHGRQRRLHHPERRLQ